MQKYSIKGLKPFFIKYMALFIGMCYLANPLQNQISDIFHEISHKLEVPDMPIEHIEIVDKQHVTHHYHEHTSSDHEHEHDIIDLLNSIFSASDDGSQEESMLVDVKFDKHISTNEYPAHKIYLIEKNFNFISSEKNLIKGYSLVLEEPPQSFSL